MAESRTKGFGDRLRRAREESGREIRSLAETTKVQSRYIEALENEEWGVVPKGVIGRGFVRVLARELGVPAAEMLQLYQASRGDADSEPDRSLPETDWKVDLGTGRKGTPLLLVGAVAVLVVVAAAVWFWGLRTPPAPVDSARGSKVPAAVEPRPEPLSPKLPVPLPTDAKTQLPPGAPVRGGGLKLELEARDRVWVKVSEDGAPGREKILKPGERVAFKAAKGFQVKIGNAGAVKLFWNGEALKPAGQTTQVVNLSLPKDLPSLTP